MTRLENNRAFHDNQQSCTAGRRCLQEPVPASVFGDEGGRRANIQQTRYIIFGHNDKVIDERAGKNFHESAIVHDCGCGLPCRTIPIVRRHNIPDAVIYRR